MGWTENAATPYSATVLINGMQYGTGVGSSKKAAKAEAAKATLEVLIPQMKEKIINETDPYHKGPTHQSDLDLSVESLHSLHSWDLYYNWSWDFTIIMTAVLLDY